MGRNGREGTKEKHGYCTLSYRFRLDVLFSGKQAALILKTKQNTKTMTIKTWQSLSKIEANCS